MAASQPTLDGEAAASAPVANGSSTTTAPPTKAGEEASEDANDQLEREMAIRVESGKTGSPQNTNGHPADEDVEMTG